MSSIVRRSPFEALKFGPRVILAWIALANALAGDPGVETPRMTSELLPAELIVRDVAGLCVQSIGGDRTPLGREDRRTVRCPFEQAGAVVDDGK